MQQKYTLTTLALASTALATVSNSTVTTLSTSCTTDITSSVTPSFVASASADETVDADKQSTFFTTDVEVVTAYTTYCPEPTEIVTNGKTYTVSEATTLTITDCPCTITKTSCEEEAKVESTSTFTDVEVVTAFTTYCPEPTEIVTNGKTYTVTEPTTLTITDCPSTVTEETVATETVPCETLTQSSISEDLTTTLLVQATQYPAYTTAVTTSAPSVQIIENAAHAMLPSVAGIFVAGMMLL